MKTKPTTVKLYETRPVLAGAYKGNRASLATTLTHLADVARDEAFCRKTLNIADPFSVTEEERQARPTCPKCAAKWDRLHA